MSWSYTGDPSSSDKDAVRFYVGDTDEAEPLVQDEEIQFALSNQSNDVKLASAEVLRALAAAYSRLGSVRVGDVSEDGKNIADAYVKRADELDPDGITKGSTLPLPSFGGLSISEKEGYRDDADAVQPAFVRNMNDIPGGPGNISNAGDDDLSDLYR